MTLDPLLVDCYAFAGVDTSHWPRLAAAGAPWHGAIIKATEGRGSAAAWQRQSSAWFRRNWPAIRAAGGDRYGVDWFRGAYHFLLARENGRDQAEHYLRTIEAAGGWGEGDIWPIIDVEEGSGNKLASRAQVEDAARLWVETVRRETGRDVVLYAGWWLAHLRVNDRLGCSQLWYASYTAILPASSYTRLGWSRDQLWAWQYAGNGVGKLAGYPMRSPIGAIDVNAVTLPGGIDRMRHLIEGGA